MWFSFLQNFNSVKFIRYIDTAWKCEKGGRGKGRWRWRRRRRRRWLVLEYQIQACKKSMLGKTWYVGTREVRSLHTLKDKVYMVSPETSIYKDLLISIAFPRFPLNPPFFFFFLVNLRNRLSIQQYHNMICPPQDANYTLHARHSIPSGALPRPWPTRTASRRRRTWIWMLLYGTAMWQ